MESRVSGNHGLERLLHGFTSFLQVQKIEAKLDELMT